MLWNFFSAFRPALRDDQIALLLSNEDVYDPALGIDDGYTFYIRSADPAAAPDISACAWAKARSYIIWGTSAIASRSPFAAMATPHAPASC
ncbi:MAG: hypothetical protein V8Q82_00790 [Christensenellales bacterium]